MSDEDSNKIEARLVIEIMGRPPEHIKETLQTLVLRMADEKGVEIVDKQYHDPIPVEESKDLFTAFVEVEAKFDGPVEFFGTVFNYMPANVEVIHPANLKMQSNSVSELANFVLGKLHQYDAVVKRTINERDILVNQLKHLKGMGPGPRTSISVDGDELDEKKDIEKEEIKSEKSTDEKEEK